MSSRCEIIGLRVRCPKTNRVVSVARSDFAIGPITSSSRHYRVRCKCGELHVAPACKVTKPTKAQKAIPR